MANWFLSTRVQSRGGPVAAEVKIINSGLTGNLLPKLQEAMQGRDVFFAVHGFNVNQQDGLDHLGFWMDKVDLGNTVKIGILWPGDCFVPIFIDYVVEGHEAIRSGDLLSAFLNANFTGAVQFSFASHSLGARVVLQTIRGLKRNVRRVLLMAGAIDDNCLTDEYADAAKNIDQISLITSKCDAVLAAAYPTGEPPSGHH
jgi:esterase/lipase superfamily enzyme